MDKPTVMVCGDKPLSEQGKLAIEDIVRVVTNPEFKKRVESQIRDEVNELRRKQLPPDSLD